MSTMTTILLVFVICYIQASCCDPALFTGKARPDLDAPETKDIRRLKGELKNQGAVDKLENKASWEGMNDIWKLSDVRVLSTIGYTISTVASGIRENFWKGPNNANPPIKNFPLTVAALKNAVCNNDFAKGLIAGKPPAYERRPKQLPDGTLKADTIQYSYDQIPKKKSVVSDVDVWPIYPKFYEPFKAKMEFKFYFGMRKTCPNQYVGDPDEKIYGPTSVSMDRDTASELFAGGGFGTVFEVTLYSDKANDISGIIDDRCLSLASEGEWIIYDLGLKHVKIDNTDVIINVANKADPCYYSGTESEWIVEKRRRQAVLRQQRMARLEEARKKREKERQNMEKKLHKKLKASTKNQGSGMGVHNHKKKKDKGGGGGGFSVSGIAKYFGWTTAEQVDFGDLVDDDGYMVSRGETVGGLDRMIEEEELEDLRKILNEIKRRKTKRKY